MSRAGYNSNGDAEAKLLEAVQNCKCSVAVVSSPDEINTSAKLNPRSVLVLKSTDKVENIGYDITLLTSFLDAPVILYLPQHDEVAEIVGLRTGAWDVLNADMSVTVLSERLKAISQRYVLTDVKSGTGNSSYDEKKNVVSIDSANSLLVVDSQKVDVTNAECRILEALLSSAGSVVRREELTPLLYNVGKTGKNRSIDNIVKRIRQKLREQQISSDLIQTVYGSGYRMAKHVLCDVQ